MSSFLIGEIRRYDLFESVALRSRLTKKHLMLRRVLREKFSFDTISSLPKDAAGRLNRQAWATLAGAGLIGRCVDREGSLGLLGTAIVTEAANRSLDSGLSSALRIQNEIAAPWLLSTNRDGIRKEFGEAVADGSIIACVSRTERDHVWKSTVRRQGSDLIINARKSLIVNVTNADITIVSAMLDDELVAVVVPMNTPGISIEREHGRHGANLVDQADLAFDDVRVPDSNQITFRSLQSTYIWNRIMCRARLTLALDAYYTAGSTLLDLIEYMSEREIYVGSGVKPLISHEEHRRWLFKAMGAYRRMSSLLSDLICKLDDGRFGVQETAFVRWYCVEQALAITRQACTLAGGRAFTTSVPFLTRHVQAFGLSMSGGSQAAMLELCRKRTWNGLKNADQSA